ncbi:MAG: rhodanese-like domain-containing protein, partial [Cloacibacterium sp.]|nr:rhodanese-like domain-containing protein [Cloacibacterium sp.]
MINETIQLVDVRERYEFELYKMGLPIVENVPFSEIEELLTHFDADKKIVLVCNNSVRSKSVA